MAIDYLNIPNGVHKIFNQTNNNVLGAMEQLNESISKIGIDFKKITYQNKKELKESQNLLKEFEKFVKSQNVDNEKDISKMSFNFAKEFTDEWERSYGGKINESTLKTLNSIASDMLELKKEAKKSYGKGFQSTSKYKEELNAFRTQSAVKLKNAKKEDEKKSEENIHITENNYIETDEIESTLNDINKNIEKLNNESFKNFGENFEQNEEYQKQFKKLFLQNQIETLKSYQKDKEEQYEKSHITDNDYVEDIIEKTNHSVLKNLENLKIEAFEKFGENFEQNEKYQSQLIQLQKKSLSEIFDAQLEKEEKLYEESYLTENKYREDTHLEETKRSILKDITNLNQEAFLKYGENFEQNKDYQKNYKSLINKATKDRIDAKQEDWDSRDDLFHDSVEKLKEVIVDQKKSLMGFLGPLNLIISPMQKFFGGSLTKYLFGKIKKGISTSVTEKQVAKLEDGSGFIYLGKKIEELIPNNNTQNLLTNDINEPNLLTNDINEPNLLTNNVNEPNLLTNNVNEPNLLTNDINEANLLTNNVSTLDRMEFTQNDANVTNSTLPTPSSFLGGNTTKFWNKKSKKRPNSTDLVNLGGIGAIGLYIGDILQKDKNHTNSGGLFNIFGESDISKKAKELLAGKISGASLVAGLVWTAVDAFHGWQNAEDWGVSKVSGAIGGALAGNGEGLGNAAKNGIKWALTLGGAGGLIGGPVGVLVGSLGGLAIGSILGYFGGEKVANEIQSVIDAFDIHSLSEGIKKIWNDSQESFFGKVGLSFVEMFEWFREGGSKSDVNKIERGVKGKDWTEGQRNFQLELAKSVGEDKYSAMFEKSLPFSFIKDDEQQLNMLQTYFSHKDSMTKEYADEWFGQDSAIMTSAYNVLRSIWGDNNLKKYFKFSDGNKILDFVEGALSLKSIDVDGDGKWENISQTYGEDWKNLQKYRDYLTNRGFKNKKSINFDNLKKNNLIKVKDAILQSNGNSQYLIRGNEKVQLDPQDNILVTTNPLGETKSYSRGELNPIINNVSDVSNSLSKTSKSEFSKVEQEIKKQNAIHNKSNTISNVTNNNSTNNSNYKNQLGDIVELLSKILDESKNKIQMPSVTRNDLLQVMGGYF